MCELLALLALGSQSEMTRRAGINSYLLFSSKCNTGAACIDVPLDSRRSVTFDNSNASMFNIDKPLLDFLIDPF